jgi:Sec-independent protein translocase protein TatA
MHKDLKVNRIFRIIAGMYLIYLSTSLWRELDTSGNKTVGIAFIILFVIVGITLIILSAKDLANMKRGNAEETEEVKEEIPDEPTVESIEEKDDTEDSDTTIAKDYDTAEDIADANGEVNVESERDVPDDVSDDVTDDSSDINTIDNIKNHTQD